MDCKPLALSMQLCLNTKSKYKSCKSCNLALRSHACQPQPLHSSKFLVKVPLF